MIEGIKMTMINQKKASHDELSDLNMRNDNLKKQLSGIWSYATEEFYGKKMLYSYIIANKWKVFVTSAVFLLMIYSFFQLDVIYKISFLISFVFMFNDQLFSFKIFKRFMFKSLDEKYIKFNNTEKTNYMNNFLFAKIQDIDDLLLGKKSFEITYDGFRKSNEYKNIFEKINAKLIQPASYEVIDKLIVSLNKEEKKIISDQAGILADLKRENLKCISYNDLAMIIFIIIENNNLKIKDLNKGSEHNFKSEYEVNMNTDEKIKNDEIIRKLFN